MIDTPAKWRERHRPDYARTGHYEHQPEGVNRHLAHGDRSYHF